MYLLKLGTLTCLFYPLTPICNYTIRNCAHLLPENVNDCHYYDYIQWYNGKSKIITKEDIIWLFYHADVNCWLFSRFDSILWGVHCGRFIFFLRITHIFGVSILLSQKGKMLCRQMAQNKNYCLMQCREKYYFLIKEIEWKELFRKQFNWRWVDLNFDNCTRA